MEEAVAYCRLYGVKTYLTVNTLIKEREWADFTKAMDSMARTGITGVIVQDMGVAEYIRLHYPTIELHGSTQMSIHSLEGALYLAHHGFTRAVLARELSLEEVRQIREHCTIELEVFIHGALCYSYSGQCLMSSSIGGRSGNRGRCAQPCRLPYQGDDHKERYLMNMKDLCSLSLIEQLRELGVHSLKIEGRLKGPEYVYGVTRAYREALDHVLSPRAIEQKRRELAQLFNRGGFSEGYWTDTASMIEPTSPKHQGVYIGTVTGCSGGRVQIHSQVPLHPLDVVEIRTSNPPYPSFQLQKKHLTKNGCLIPISVPVQAGMDVYRLIDQELMNVLKNHQEERNVPVEATVELSIGKPAHIVVTNGTVKAEAYGAVVQKATGHPMDEDSIAKQLRKSGGTAFTINTLTIHAEQNLFIPISALNALRREALSTLKAAIVQVDVPYVEVSHTAIPITERAVSLPQLEAVISSVAQWEVLKKTKILTFFRMECFSNGELHTMADEAEKLGIPYGISLPHIQKTQQCATTLRRLKAITENCAVLVHNMGQLEMLADTPYKRYLDFTVPVANKSCLRHWLRDVDSVTISTELSLREIQQLQGMPREALSIVVYGKIPVMTTAQCTLFGQGRCQKRKAENGPIYSAIKDRKKETWLCEHHCAGQTRLCYTMIYPAAPIWIADRSRALRKLPAGNFRLLFLDEGSERVEQVLSQYQRALHENEEVSEPSWPYQRGHFYKEIL